jgi:AAA15 family ATPase/GTPase
MDAPLTPINIYIVYTSGDESLYREFEPYIKKLKKSGDIHSYYGRKIIGKKWDHVTSEKLADSRVILLLVSPEFLDTEYCYQEEAHEMVDLHNRGAASVVPVLLKETDISDTPFAALDVYPSNGKSISNRYWGNTKNAMDNIFEEIKGVLQKIVTPSPDIFKFNGKAFPYCIKQFSIKNFLCIKDIYMGEIPGDTQWIFITGHNGDGKTALLQALAVGLLGNDDASAQDLLKGGNSRARIEIEFKDNGENQICRFFKEKENWKTEYLGPKKSAVLNFMAYGVTRLSIMPEEAEEKQIEKQHPAYSLYHETQGNFKNIETWLKQHSEKVVENEKPIVKEIKKTLQKLMPNIESILVEGFPKKEVIYIEKGFDARYEHVSSGSKMVVAVIGDMFKRFIDIYPNAQTVADFEGIVLIDELDLHLHPIWQRKLPGLLSSTFPKIQFWATTHSIVPFMGAPKNSLFFILDRTAEKGTCIEKLPIDLKNISPNLILSSPLFNVNLLTSQNENPDEFQTHDDWKTFEKFEQINKKLYRKQK